MNDVTPNPADFRSIPNLIKYKFYYMMTAQLNKKSYITETRSTIHNKKVK